MSTVEIRCTLHISANFVKAHFCAAPACAGSLLNLSDFSLMRNEQKLLLEVRTVRLSTLPRRPSSQLAPHVGSSALDAQMHRGGPPMHALTAWCGRVVSVFVSVVFRDTPLYSDRAYDTDGPQPRTNYTPTTGQK